MTREEVNPSQQRGVSVDVLAERLSNQTDMMRSEFSALHHHFTSLETKVEAAEQHTATVEIGLREHVTQLHHEGTRDRLLEVGKTQLEFERKIGQLAGDIATVKQERLLDQTATNARTKVTSAGFTFADKMIGLVILLGMLAAAWLR